MTRHRVNVENNNGSIRLRWYYNGMTYRISGLADGQVFQSLPTYNLRNTSITEFIRSMKRVAGIEPAYSAWEADILPLNYTRILSHHISISQTCQLLDDSLCWFSQGE